jgi:Predicted Zn-dependent hydrolases of the beta-lactamase fold
MLSNIKFYEQNSIKIGDIYFDPFNVTDELHDAKLIFLTHSHYDHLSIEDLIKVKNENTVIIVPEDVFDKVKELFSTEKIIVVEPNNRYNIEGISFETVPMYNIEKSFHPKENKWVGYVINYNNYIYYIVGDSDATKEMLEVKCDALFIPIGGKFTMDIDEAVDATITINPKVVIPVHYGTIIGSFEDGEIFKSKIPVHIECILKK